MSNNKASFGSAPNADSTMLTRSLSYVIIKTQGFWNVLPQSLRQSSLGMAYGKRLNSAVRRFADRKQYFSTYFLRNRPELELMRRIVDRKPQGSHLSIAVVGCSKGPEVYSIAWILRRARPDLKIKIQAVDISAEILEFARNGIYSCAEMDITPDRRAKVSSKRGSASDVDALTGRDQMESLFQRLSEEEIKGMFDIEGDDVKIQNWLRQDIDWHVGDAGSLELRTKLGPQEIVVANRFLCHMRPPDAESCLRNIGRLAKPGGYLFVSGVDLDVRTRVAADLGWKPVPELLREIHEGDTSLRGGWPLGYWSLEPFDESKCGWQLRYASVFQLAEATGTAQELLHSQAMLGD